MADDRSPNLQTLHVLLASLCEKAARCFVTDVRVSLIIRDPANDQADVVISDDTIDGLRGLLDRSELRNEYPHPTSTHPASDLPTQ